MKTMSIEEKWKLEKQFKQVFKEEEQKLNTRPVMACGEQWIETGNPFRPLDETDREQQSDN